MQGYWNAEEESERVFKREGRRSEAKLFTGDFFKADGDGYLYFVGRKE